MTRNVDRGASATVTLSCVSLTSENLVAVPKRHLQEYLSAYIRDQRKFVIGYVNDQNEEANMSDDQNVNPNLPAASVSTETFGNLVFGTPVLKARVQISHEPHEKVVGICIHNKMVTKSCDDKTMKSNGLEDVIPSSTKKRCAPVVQDENYIMGKDQKKEAKRSKRLHPAIDHSQDHVKRLEERRQRKRARKDTMLPPTTKHNNDPHCSLASRSTCIKKTQKQSKNAQVGFALMHGFSATNVGKNRLTVQPFVRDSGVFKKGKASTKKNVESKKKGDLPHYFSEAKFLNSKTPKIRPPSPTTSASSTISSVSGINSPQRFQGVLPKGPKLRGLDSPIPAIETQPASRYNPADSIVWDIEKDSEVMSNSDSRDRQGTILVQYSRGSVDAAEKFASKKIAPSISDHSLEPGHENSSECSPLCPATNKSSSLCPSQSASQLGLETRTRLEHGTTLPNQSSKYFPCAELATSMQNATPFNFDTTIPEASVSIKPSECHSPSDFDGLMLASEKNVETLHDDNLRDLVEDFNFQENLSEDYRVTNTPSNMRLDSFPLTNDRWWSPSDIDIDLPEFDHPRLSNAFKGPILDSLILESDSALARNFEDFQTQILDDMLGNNVEHTADLFNGEYSFDPNFACPDRKLALAPESLEPFASGLFSDFGVPDIDPQIRYYRHGDSSPCKSTMIQAFSEQAVSMPGNDIVLDHSDTYRPASESPDLEEDDTIFESFRQGRILLYGCSLSPGKLTTRPNQLSNVEAEVAGTLKLGHWLPQRL